MIKVAAAFLVHNHKVFIARRAPSQPLAGKWEFPGGKVEAGESVRACLARELAEPLNGLIAPTLNYGVTGKLDEFAPKAKIVHIDIDPTSISKTVGADIPIVGPVILMGEIDPVWFAILFAMNLQTSFMTPPFGFSLFYLKGVSPPEIKTGHIYRGIIPFVVLQAIALILVVLYPKMATCRSTVVHA